MSPTRARASPLRKASPRQPIHSPNMCHSPPHCNTSHWSLNVTSTPPATDAMPFVAIFLCLIIFFSVAGNLLVCVAVFTDRNLRKTSNYFVVSLAVSDALVALLVMTFAVANDLVGKWMFGDSFCNIWISFDVMFSTASILNLCAISLDRYIHIRNSLHYHLLVTSRRTIVCIGCVWILSALISFFPIQMGWHKGSADRDQEQCLLELNPLYAVASSTVSFYLPCLVMILIYLRLYRYARMHLRSIREQTTAVGGYGTPDAGTDGSTEATRTTHRRLSDHKAAITLGVIMGVFLFCWTPFFTVNLIGAFCSYGLGGSCVPPILFSVFTWLGYFNSTLNPLIYSIFNQEFRVAFKRILLAGTCCTRRRCASSAKRRGRHQAAQRAVRTNGAMTPIEYGYLTPVKHCYQVISQDVVTSV